MSRHRTGTVFRDAEGRWWARVRYKDELGQRREKRRRARTKSDANDARDDLLAEIKKHGVLAFAHDRVTFEQLAEYYIANYLTEPEYRDGRKISGLRNWLKFRSTVKTLKTHFGQKRLRTLTFGDLRNYRLVRLKARNKRNDKQPLSIAAVNRELSMLRRMLSIARQQGWAVVDLFEQGEALITPADERHRKRVLASDEEERLLAGCIGPRAHLRGLVICGVDTGMRRGEILLLRWKDVDLTGGLITIQALHTKTIEERQVGITPRLAEEFKRLHEAGYTHDEERVFGLTSNFKRSFKTACTNAAIEDLRFHDLRHTFASRLADKGMPDTSIARLLGHRQVRTTFRYINITPETARQAADMLSEAQPE